MQMTLSDEYARRFRRATDILDANRDPRSPTHAGLMAEAQAQATLATAAAIRLLGEK